MGVSGTLALPPEMTVPRLPRALVVLCVVFAFRGALLAQQALFAASLTVAACPVSVNGGLGSTKVSGLEACTGPAATFAALVGVLGTLAVAVPLLVLFRRLDRRRRNGQPLSTRTAPRAAGVFGYLLCLAAIAEAASGAVVMSVLDHGEAAHAVRLGVPLVVLVGVGILAVAAAYPSLRSTSHVFVVDLLGHDIGHVELMQKAVLVKLTLGVALISATHLVLG